MLYRVQFSDKRLGSEVIHSFMISKNDISYDKIKSMIERKIGETLPSNCSLFLTSEGKGK